MCVCVCVCVCMPERQFSEMQLGDDHFWQYLFKFILLTSSPHAYMDPLCTNLTYMFVALFKDALNEYAYAAELAGLGYDLHNTIYGLTVSKYSILWCRPDNYSSLHIYDLGSLSVDTLVNFQINRLLGMGMDNNLCHLIKRDNFAIQFDLFNILVNWELINWD